MSVVSIKLNAVTIMNIVVVIIENIVTMMEDFVLGALNVTYMKKITDFVTKK